MRRCGVTHHCCCGSLEADCCGSGSNGLLRPGIHLWTRRRPEEIAPSSLRCPVLTGDTRHSEGQSSPKWQSPENDLRCSLAQSTRRHGSPTDTFFASRAQTVFERVPWFTKTLRRRFSHLLRQWQLSTVKTFRRHGIIDGFARR